MVRWSPPHPSASEYSFQSHFPCGIVSVMQGYLPVHLMLVNTHRCTSHTVGTHPCSAGLPHCCLVPPGHGVSEERPHIEVSKRDRDKA